MVLIINHSTPLFAQYKLDLPVLPKYIVYILANENSIHEIPTGNKSVTATKGC